jgi:hypothetical protein
MLLPADFDSNPSDRVYGFQLAAMSFLGTLEGTAVCVVGLFANVGFVMGYLFVVSRWGMSARAAFWVVLPVPVAMLVCHVWLFGAQILRHVPSPAFVAWLGSGVLLTWAAWRVNRRVPGPQRGFEVLPAAAPPMEVDRTGD